MELDKIIENRRSIRSYTNQPVSKKDLLEMIACAKEAPSWKNSQTARYHIAYSAVIVEELKQKGMAPFNAENTKNAPVLIVTSFVKDHSGFNKDKTPSNELGNLWGAYDLGLQNENLILKARELGLDTLIMGIRDADQIRAILSIPDDEIIVSVIGVGYRNINPDKPKRKEIDDITTFY